MQLGGLLLYPWMETSPSGRALFTAFGVIVLGARRRAEAYVLFNNIPRVHDVKRFRELLALQGP